jgi:uncharacterized membrane protein
MGAADGEIASAFCFAENIFLVLGGFPFIHQNLGNQGVIQRRFYE